MTEFTQFELAGEMIAGHRDRRRPPGSSTAIRLQREEETRRRRVQKPREIVRL